MSIEIIAAESLGVRSLCCLVTVAHRRIVIDPGISLGYLRHGLLPHPLQIAQGQKLRDKILNAVNNATDIVFSHFHGDHVPLRKANPYQLAIKHLPGHFNDIRYWSKSDADLSISMKQRYRDLAELLQNSMKNAEGLSQGPMAFSRAVPHGERNGKMGTLMMTRIEMDNGVFVHASDIQLLDDATVDKVINWQPNIALAAGPPLYLEQLGKKARERAWNNALRLAANIDTVILDHHLMRSREGEAWLQELSTAAGKNIFCAADFMNKPRLLLEANRKKLYQKMPVADDWHDNYAKGLVSVTGYIDNLESELEEFT